MRTIQAGSQLTLLRMQKWATPRKEDTAMLHEFLTSNRTELIMRWRNKVGKRFAPVEIPLALDHGVPLFLQQLVETLRLEQRKPYVEKFEAQPTPAPTEIGRAAAVHGLAAILQQSRSVSDIIEKTPGEWSGPLDPLEGRLKMETCSTVECSDGATARIGAEERAKEIVASIPT